MCIIIIFTFIFEAHVFVLLAMATFCSFPFVHQILFSTNYVLYLPLVSCETLQSTTDIIVNLTSTAMSSNATYQCRDGSSDVYTTQCTSDGVWEPNPNSTLDCRIPGKI